ncbi:MAG: hypothetical protein JXR19_05325 [Bacteroidia bacterium]
MRLLKWLFFTILCAAYVWVVFFWMNKEQEVIAQELPTMEDVPAIETTETIDSFEQDVWIDSGYADDGYDTTEQFEETIAFEDEGQFETSGLSSRPYLVIYGSYLEADRAIKALGLLPFDCIECEIVYIDPYHKLVLSRSETLSDAKSMLADFQERGINGFIQKYQN